jgi:hypothetical protein
MNNLMVTISDGQGHPRTYVIIKAGLEENWVSYAILSPEDPDSDPDDYIAVGYEDRPNEDRGYFLLPGEISFRLVCQFLTPGTFWRELAQA